MTEKEFLKLFRKHCKIIRKVKSYKAMLWNLTHPTKLSGHWCPFGGEEPGSYYVVLNGAPNPYSSMEYNHVGFRNVEVRSGTDKDFEEAVSYWMHDCGLHTHSWFLDPYDLYNPIISKMKKIIESLILAERKKKNGNKK